LVSGAHLDEKFGYTKKEIARDGFKVYAEIKSEIKADTLFHTTQAIGNIIINLGRELKKIKPDFLVVYADRFEGLAAAVTGSQMGIPVAHIEGGDVTMGGALDDSVRYAITKLSHLHFTTNEDAARRIEKVGEEKWRVFNAGFSAIDLIKQKEFASPEEIEQKFSIDAKHPTIIFTQHSVTTEVDDVVSQLKPSLNALKYFAKIGTQVIVTYPNNDAGGRRAIGQINKLMGIKNIMVVSHLGRYWYLGLLNICGRYGTGVCAGNSSSGIKETPAFGCPFVNIGSRQKGRLRSTNVIDVDYKTDQIIKAINKSLIDKSFREKCRKCKNPYGKGDTGRRIARVLSAVKIDKNLIQKKITY